MQSKDKRDDNRDVGAQATARLAFSLSCEFVFLHIVIFESSQEEEKGMFKTRNIMQFSKELSTLVFWASSSLMGQREEEVTRTPLCRKRTHTWQPWSQR